MMSAASFSSSSSISSTSISPHLRPLPPFTPIQEEDDFYDQNSSLKATPSDCSKESYYVHQPTPIHHQNPKPTVKPSKKRPESHDDDKTVSCNKCRPSVREKFSVVIPLDTTTFGRHSNVSPNGLFKSIFSSLKKSPKSTSSSSENLTPATLTVTAPATEQQWRIAVAELSHKLISATKKRDEAILEASRLKFSVTELEKKLNKLEMYCHNLKSGLDDCANKTKTATKHESPSHRFHIFSNPIFLKPLNTYIHTYIHTYTNTMIPQTNDNHPNITSDTTEPEPEPPTDHDIPYCSEFIPPESFWLSKDSEFDWFDRNAFLERKESTKGNSNNSKSSNNGPTSYSRSNSQKFSVNLKSKPAIIGLPKTQRNTHVDSNRRQCRPVQAVRMFPKRSGSSGRTTVTEPTSPKVSCIGRVRSKRCPNRRRSNTQPVKERKPVVQEKKEKTGKGEKTGIISRITSLFRFDGNSRKKGNNNNNKSGKVNEQVENLYSRKNSVKPVNSEPASPPDAPALGGMNRFASGRRSVTWTDDIDVAVRRS